MQTDLGLRTYELMVILSGDLTEGDFEKEMDELRKMLKENAKAIVYEDVWGKRELAYKVRKQKRGYYAIFNFNATPQAIAELRVTVKLNPHVLRHLLLVLPEDYEPEGYKKDMPIFDRKKDENAESSRKFGRKKEERKVVVPEKAAAAETPDLAKPTVAGKEEEEELKTVEKKLEKILENPDIQIR